MHIAICDENVADRKHLERLLGRESDKRAAQTGILYTDSFGKSEPLLQTPLQYDLFFIDMPSAKELTYSIVESLIRQGVTAPIVLCSGEVNHALLDYSFENYESQILFLDKPMTADKLIPVIDHTLSVKDMGPSFIELRVDNETIYAPFSDFLYAVANGSYVTVTLKHKSIRILSTPENFYSNISVFPEVCYVSGNLIINLLNLQKTDGLFVQMNNGRRFLVSPAALLTIKKMLKNIPAKS